MDDMTIKTNHVPRLVIDAYELTAAERADFDYIDWPAVDRGEDSATFFRYKGQLYDLGEFDTTIRLPYFNPLRQWDGYQSDSFFSGIVVRFHSDGGSSEWDHVIVGTFFA